MAVPIRYNIRNLILRKSATVMTALGIALTVTTAIFILALLAGLNAAFRTSGNPLNVLVLRKGSNAELAAGGVDRDLLPVMKDLPGVAHDAAGQPLASGEDLLVVVLPRNDGTGETNVTVRFLTPTGIAMRSEAKLAAGRWFQPGQREIVVSQSIHNRFAQANLGDTIWIGKGPWTVVGIFDAGGTAHDSEIWGDVDQIMDAFNRRPAFSSITR